MFVESIRLLIVLLLTAAGSELGLLVSDGELSQLLGTTLGAGVGYVTGGVLGRKVSIQMGRIEVMRLPWSAAEVLAGGVFAFLGGAVGLIAGLGVLIGLGPRWGGPVVAVLTWVGAAAGARLGLRLSSQLWGLVGLSPIGLSSARRLGEEAGTDALLVDSSAVLDGRLLGIIRAGFISGTLLVPRFVLDEVQAIADAQDVVRRRRGRRGLELIEALDNEPDVAVRIIDDEVPEVVHVDAKLVTLGRRLGVRLITNDQPLVKVAELQGVPCLFVGRLADGLRNDVTPGEVLTVEIVREGSEAGQGVGYAADGSMVVVTDAADHVDQVVPARVSHSVPTSKGTMHFATLDRPASVAGAREHVPHTEDAPASGVDSSAS